jgi:hypothetical protein
MVPFAQFTIALMGVTSLSSPISNVPVSSSMPELATFNSSAPMFQISHSDQIDSFDIDINTPLVTDWLQDDSLQTPIAQETVPAPAPPALSAPPASLEATSKDEPAVQLSQITPSIPPVPVPEPDSKTVIRRGGSKVLGQPEVNLQGVYKLEGSESSARGRVRAYYPVTPNLLFGGVVDLSAGDGFSDSPGGGLQLNELYMATSLPSMPNLRFVAGLMDLTSYFDRNSFAKDGASQFFNRAFQTNPALSAAGLGSRIGALVNWDITEDINVKAATFSADRGLGKFALDSFAAELGVRFGTAIIRGTYVSSKDAGRNNGFEEIYGLPRGGGDFGLKDSDREHAYGLNGEWYIPEIKLGFFGRYGWYGNESLGRSGQTYSFGVTRPDLFMARDRLGLAYGRQLSNNELRRQNDDKIPDVLELYYDFPVFRRLRLGFSLQQRNQFSETVFGVRLNTNVDLLPRREF